MQRRVANTGTNNINSIGVMTGSSGRRRDHPGLRSTHISIVYQRLRLTLLRMQPPTLLLIFVSAVGIVYVLLARIGGGSSSKLLRSSDYKRCRILETSSSSQLSQLTELDLNGCDLKELSPSIRFCTNLQKLDVSNNPRLSTLPPELTQCAQLDVLFASSNPGIKSLPSVLGTMTSVTRLGWRSGSLTELNANAIPPNVVHLILTNNEIQTLDSEEVFDRLVNVRKLMLSHNQIRYLLPNGVAKLKKLELLRLAGNQIGDIPKELWKLPKLTWLTISGNEPLRLPKLERRVPTIELDEMEAIGDDESSFLGAGASGSVRLRRWNNKDVAVKVIHGVTSDGRAEDELAIYSAIGQDGMDNRVVGCLAVFEDKKEGKNGVVMETIPSGEGGEPLEDFALPPTILEVTADRWPANKNRIYDDNFVLSAMRDAIMALSYLHNTAGVAHGDFYAHNIKVDNASGRLYLLDFGASYAKGRYAKEAEKIEVRAFGILLQELLERRREEADRTNDGSQQSKAIKLLEDLIPSCLDEDVSSRPSFSELKDVIFD